MADILDDFLVVDEKGLYCRYGSFYLDPLLPVSSAVISHAHGDHARPDNRDVYATLPTLDIMKHRFGKKAYRHPHAFPVGQTFTIGPVSLCFLAAGHILGSAQVLMEYKGVRYLYTGDYKLQEDATCVPMVFAKADVLITESTFARPNVAHPDPIVEIQKLSQVRQNILLGVYALGKAQRLTYLINQHCPEKTVWLHHTILPIHRLYEAHGCVPMQYYPYNRKALKHNSQGQVYMVPPMTFRHYFRAKDVVRVFASGWARLHVHNDMELYISDHVDWNDILYTIKQVEPKQVWTLHGDGRALAQYFDGTAVKVKELIG